MKIKTSDLVDKALDWAVASANGATWAVWRFKEEHADGLHNYSEDWSQGGPIIERERIEIWFEKWDDVDCALPIWGATRRQGSAVAEEWGFSPLIAAMRCYVANKLGNEIDVPDELVA